MSFFASFDKTACKVNLKMAITRMKQMKNRQEQNIKNQKREVAELLRQHKEDLARVRVEHVICESRNVEALELLELFCDMLLARYALIETEKHCPDDIAEAVSTIVWAAARSNVPELVKVREQFQRKYGKEFVAQAMAEQRVNVRVSHRLNYSAPESYLIMQHLTEIANEYDVPWEGENVLEGSLIPDLPPPIAAANGGVPPPTAPGPGGFPGGGAAFAMPLLPPGALPGGLPPYPFGGQFPTAPYGYGEGMHAMPVVHNNNGYPPNTGAVLPPPPPVVPPAHDYPPPPPQPPVMPFDGRVPDFDELTARFEALKQKAKQ